jgi:hypothetical protein
MYQVTRWLEDFALASMGLDANVIEDVSNLSESALEPVLKEKVTTLPFDEAMTRVAALREIGRNGRRMHPAQFKEVLTAAHFSDYFADAISRAFYADYQYSVGGWRDYTYADTTPDFRDVSRFRMSEPGKLQKRREKAQHAATYVTETEINYGVEEYSVEFDVSWRTIVNDDLGKIRETPTRMANAARRWLDEWVSALYDNATTQATLLALGAVYGGTGRLTAANLAIGLNAMMQRVDANGNQMNINRVWLVIPKILQIQAADILQDILAYGGPGGNVLAQFVAGVRVDPYIAFAGANVPWYLFADPSEVPTVTVARMEGVPGPAVFQRSSDISMISGTMPGAFTMGDYATGNIWFAVEDIVGGWDDASYVGVTDFRGIYYSNGTTA